MPDRSFERNIAQDTKILGPVAFFSLTSGAIRLSLQVHPQWETFAPLLGAAGTMHLCTTLAAVICWPALTSERPRLLGHLRQKMGAVALAGEISALTSFVFTTWQQTKHMGGPVHALLPIVNEYAPIAPQHTFAGIAAATLSGLYMGWQYQRLNRHRS